MGWVLDQIACYQIAKGLAKERKRPGGSLADQMKFYYGR